MWLIINLTHVADMCESENTVSQIVHMMLLHS